jgi:hypothetical protein
MRPTLILSILVLGSTVGCLRDTAFHCTRNSDCDNGGSCQSDVGFCSVADPSCATGERFGSSAGTYANQCVGDGVVDAGTDGPVDGMVDAPTGGCPGNYSTIVGGQGTHVYRRVMATDNWQTQRTLCSNVSPSAYLAIPDDLAELQAISMVAGTDAWVGISDLAQENTFVTVANAPATFLPWDVGQPDDQGPGEDCVIIANSSNQLRDERCSNKFRAVCECEP